MKTVAADAEKKVEQEKEKEREIAIKEREEAAAFAPTFSKNPSSTTRISVRIMRLFLRIESKANEDKEKKAMREKLKRDS